METFKPEKNNEGIEKWNEQMRYAADKIEAALARFQEEKEEGINNKMDNLV